MKDKIFFLFKQILSEMGIRDVDPEIEIPDDSSHGDYSSSVALKLSKTLKMAPMDIALQVAEKIKSLKSGDKAKSPHHITDQRNQTISKEISAQSVLRDIDHVEVVPPGFINFFLTEAKLSSQLTEVLRKKDTYGSLLQQGKSTGKSPKIMVEFAHPNTHKAFHIGHLRNITTGESIVRLLVASGNEIIRANYQGDVGMHIAKAMYGLVRLLIATKDKITVNDLTFVFDKLSKLEKERLSKRIELLGKAYAEGNKVYEQEPLAKTAIGEINKNIYSKGSNGVFARYYEIYRMTRQWSLDYFSAIYKRVGSHFDRLYFESEVYESGKKNVLSGLKKGIFEESEGAIIFPGEKFGLHNRVFITGEGNATYEGKDMGLGPLQFSEYHPDRIIHVVGPEQAGYFKVIFEALAQLFPETRGKEYHLVYGWVKLKHGKMSSRSGNVVLGEWLLDEAKKEINTILQKSKSNYSKEDQEMIAEKAAVAAVKYSFLKVTTEREIAFDLAESVNFEGDSGPYLQYTYARCKSVLRKAGDFTREIATISNSIRLEKEEREVARLIMYFPEVVASAAQALGPSTLCSYLFTLAQAFNLFYAKHSILGIAKSAMGQVTEANSRKASDTRILRLSLTGATAQVLKNGLYLLGIETLKKM